MMHWFFEDAGTCPGALRNSRVKRHGSRTIKALEKGDLLRLQVCAIFISAHRIGSDESVGVKVYVKRAQELNFSTA